mmetsp:Transcript_40471/g.95071  ORF Transcript_40471/g.95071 Transcript_40471/m.95071 type:complete len:184 (-) Transcript_40471:318-869(-)
MFQSLEEIEILANNRKMARISTVPHMSKRSNFFFIPLYFDKAVKKEDEREAENSLEETIQKQRVELNTNAEVIKKLEAFLDSENQKNTASVRDEKYFISTNMEETKNSLRKRASDLENEKERLNEEHKNLVQVEQSLVKNIDDLKVELVNKNEILESFQGSLQRAEDEICKRQVEIDRYKISL